jgi:hypothetical protein
MNRPPLVRTSRRSSAEWKAAGLAKPVATLKARFVIKDADKADD